MSQPYQVIFTSFKNGEQFTIKYCLEWGIKIKLNETSHLYFESKKE